MTPTKAFLAIMLYLFALTSAGAQEPRLAGRPETIDEFLRLGERPRVIAHRGFSGIAPENTLAALRAAMEIGADMVEFDVGLTSDGAVVLLHDETLERTTNGHGTLARTAWEDIRELDAGSWFSAEFADERVPLLDDALSLLRDQVLVNIEIKGEAVTDHAQGGIADRVLELVRRNEMLDQVILSSFDPRALKHARQLERRVKTASLFEPGIHGRMGPVEVMRDADSNGFNIAGSRLKKKMVCDSHRYGRPLAVYTVNDEKSAEKLVEMGVHAFFTDRPDVLIRFLAGRPSARSAGSDC